MVFPEVLIANYDMIELANLFDLDKARIVQAQINSIDSANNCANITFSSECVELAGLSVNAVKFFYHCENSTGTEEDLADLTVAFPEPAADAPIEVL